jgi:hypothetical protein
VSDLELIRGADVDLLDGAEDEHVPPAAPIPDNRINPPAGDNTDIENDDPPDPPF